MQNRPGTFNEFSYTPKLAGLDDTGSSLITLTVYLARYRANLRAITELARPAKVIAVVKANAYGFGIGGLLPILSEFDSVSLGVANADEALEIRSLGYGGRIILLGYTHPKNYYQIIHSGCQLAAYRVENIPQLAEAAEGLDRPLELHIKVDTGMTRLGVPVAEVGRFIGLLKEHPQLKVVGLFSHLVDSGVAAAEINALQAERFRQAVRQAEDALGYHPECHLANSGGLLNFPDMHHDAVRIGLLPYGIKPPGEWAGGTPLELEPCLKLASEVIDLHSVQPGDGVSYTHSFVADRATAIATMPLGYADGLFRSLSNRGEVLIRGRRCPLAGNVTMDYVMADVGDLPVEIGDEVVFIGEQGDEEITVEDVATQAGVLPYEVTCALGRRVRREYVEE